ncbi:MAG TPA: hypothetical protein VGI26_08710 [Solirubrobacteraceae bacterium]|jgi:hypothetical protein
MQRIQGKAVIGRPLAAGALALALAATGLAAQASGGTTRLTRAGKTAPIATAARRVSLVENAHLKFAAEHGSALSERGSATGTYDAPVAVTLTIHPKTVTATVTIYPSGGSITGYANANYTVKGSYGYFGGTMTVSHGTGKYRHISEVNGKPLGFSGKISHISFAMEVKAHGEANL